MHLQLKSNLPQLLPNLILQPYIFGKQLRQFIRQPLHLLLKRLAIVFSISDADIASWSEDEVLSLDICSGAYSAIALLIFERSVLELMEGVGNVQDFGLSKLTYGTSHHLAHLTCIDEERLATLRLIAREEPQRDRNARAIEKLVRQRDNALHEVCIDDVATYITFATRLTRERTIGQHQTNGALSSQSGGEGDIRRNIINADLVEGIIALPDKLFYSTGIPVSLWFLSRNKAQRGKTLFIDARQMGEMVTRAVRELTEAEILHIADTFHQFQNGTLEDEKGYCAVRTTADIEAQDFILTPGRYVGIADAEDDGEPFEEKMERLTNELSELFAEDLRLQNEIREQLGKIGYKVR